LLAHYGGEVTRANIHPPVREKILERYSGGRPFGGPKTAGAGAGGAR
jgi:hypothetical protein